jgi:tetratricopeptide (TPR) repeat protein
MSEKFAKHGIEINRNPVERFLMEIKSFIKSNKKLVIVFFSILILFTGLFIIGYIYFENVENTKRTQLDGLVEKYYEAVKSGNSSTASVITNEIIVLGKSSRFGFSSKMSAYTAGNFLYDEKKYKEAADLLTGFADKNSKSIFASVAIQKAALAYEEAGNLDAAYSLYIRLEKDYAGSIISDQFFYNFGRIYSLKGDIINAKKYFNIVISSYPQSPYAELAKKRIFMLSYKKS